MLEVLAFYKQTFFHQRAKKRFIAITIIVLSAGITCCIFSTLGDVEKPYSGRIAKKLKIVLVGPTAGGKTSLINRFTRNIFSNSYISTIGCDNYVKNVVLHDAAYKLVVHDLGG